MRGLESGNTSRADVRRPSISRVDFGVFGGFSISEFCEMVVAITHDEATLVATCKVFPNTSKNRVVNVTSLRAADTKSSKSADISKLEG